VIVGLLAGAVSYAACTKIKTACGYDDALDTFGVHAVAGTLGAFMTGIFATAEVNGNLTTHLKDIVGRTLWLEQLKAIGLTIVLAVAATAIIGWLVKSVFGLRPRSDAEWNGLDLTDHGEQGYIYEQKF
jgi:Amt family ammonium transporter